MKVVSDLVSVAGVQEMLNISQRTVYRWIQTGELPAPVRLSKRCIRFSRIALQEFLEKKTRQEAG